jgi:hypothetical protein
MSLSRSRKKMILVVLRSIFALFSAEEEVFTSAPMWKNLLDRMCRQCLWRGIRDGIPEAVWGALPDRNNKGPPLWGGEPGGRDSVDG